MASSRVNLRVVLISCAVFAGAATTLFASREGSAQRAPLIVATIEPLGPGLRAHPRARVSELRVEDDGRFSFNGRTGRLTRGQLQALRAERGRVRWAMAPSSELCDAIPTESRRVQSQGRSIAWQTPCSPAPHASVVRFVARAEAIVRGAPSTDSLQGSTQGDASVPTSADASATPTPVVVADGGAASSDPRACTGPGQCVLACPQVAGCCGFPCGCTAAIHRDHLAAFTANYARTCQRAPNCEPVGCAMQMRSASCVNGRCVTVPGVGL